MFDMNSLPVPGGINVAGALWVGVSAFALGPVVADRTIENSGWHKMCQSDLRRSTAMQAPKPQSKPDIACGDIMKLLGNGADSFCNQGVDAIFDLLMIDPLAAQKERARKMEAERLARIAALSPSRCDCAARVVGADRVSWGLYAGSARLIGGPQNLQSTLTQALHSPACALRGEG